jgi:hypothetical protein
MGELSLATRPGPALRCAVCHDELPSVTDARVSCPDCQTVLHRECRTGLGRCPTLGCRGSALSAGTIAARALEEEEPEPPSFWFATALSVFTSCFALALHLAGADTAAFVALALLSVPHFVLAPVYWATRLRARGAEYPRDDVLTVFKVLALETLGCSIVAPTFAHFSVSDARVVSLLASLGLALAVILGPPAIAWLVGTRGRRPGDGR